MEKHIGHKITWLDSVDSTNEEIARRLLNDEPIKTGEVFAAHAQLKGKGQGEKTWESMSGKNLTFSFLLRPSFLTASEQFILNMVVSLGVYELIKTNFPGRSIKIKWPNDIYVEEKKIAGILINHTISGNTIDYSIIGIGLNVNQESFTPALPNPVSMKQISHKKYNVQSVLGELMQHLNDFYSLALHGHYEEFREAYKFALFGYYKWLRFKHDKQIIVAKVTGISELGFLQLETDENKKIECDLKDIEFLI